MNRPATLTDAQIWNSELTMSIAVTIFIGVVTVLVVVFFGIWKFRAKASPSQTETTRKYRFRKRDKIVFFGRKMLRKVRSFTRNTVGPSAAAGGLRRKPSKLMISRLRRFLAERRESAKPRLKQQSPPQSFLEADWSDMGEDHRLPPEVLYMLRSVRVFGHLEKPFFLELIRFMETITLRSGDFLFKIGDPDDSIFVVQDGRLEVFITDADGTEHLVKEVATGNSIHSLLSILDVLTGHPGSFRSVSARAVKDSTILRLPAHAFKSMFEKFNESAVKVVQIIMVRLQRVTFSALHNYLGLSKELLKSDGIQADVKELNIHRLNRQSSTPGSASPSKSVTSNPTVSAMVSAMGSLSSSTVEGKGTENDEEELSMKTVSEGQQQTSEESEDKFHTPPIQYSTASRKSNASMLMGETSDQLSDFDQALMRARVSITDDKSIVLSGSPPRARRWSTDPAGHAASFRSRHLPDESHILSLASKDLVQILGLKDPSLLKDRLTLKKVRAGTIFCKQGDQDTSLFFLVKGSVNVVQNVVGESSKEALMYNVEPGEIMDVLAVLTGEPSFFTMRSKTDAIMVVISKLDFYQIMRSEPFIVLNVAHQTVKRMSNFVRQIDFALDWQMLEAGKALFRQGDTSDSIFIVLTGRLRSVITSVGGKKELVNEFGRGELVGIVEVLTQTERATTVLAIRDTEVTKIPSELLSLIKLRYPQVVARLIHLLGTRILGTLQQRNNINLQSSVSMDNDTKMERSTVANLATIAIVPVTEDVPLTNFTLELQHALLAIGPTVRLTPDIVRARLGTAALDGVNEFRLFNWLSQQEDIHRMVLYQCDHQLTKWSKHCLRQADCILIVALADKEPTIGPIEKELENIAVRAQKELVLLHQEDAETPRNTAEWLNARGWLSSHHHLRCPKRVLKVKSPAKTLELYERLFDNPPNRMADFSRLARFLTGTSIGLVLGGGGARGLAHVGMIKAMTEEGIPIDMVGGTSMGAFIGALWAEERQYVPFTRRAREWAMGMTSLWKKIWDLTYPMTSMFTGWAFNESIETVFRDRQIEDLWIPYFCITTNISNSSMRVHSLGSIWRYVRASMSLSGYLPPLCDPVDGHLLLDGGYVNNLPADVMHHLGANFVFAVDVGSQDEKDHTNYGDSLSGWWLLWKRWNPWAEPVKVPDMTEIQSRLAYVSCVRQLELVKNSDYCEYIRPPIDRYATLQFGAYDEIMETGFHHGKTLFSTWQKGGLADKLFVDYQASSSTAQKSGPSKGSMESKNQLRNHVPVMAYFTDLAEQVSKIDKPKSKFFLQDGEEDDVYEEVDEDEEEPGILMDGYEEDDEFADDDEEYVEEEDEDDEEDNDDAVMDGNDESKGNGGGAERRKVNPTEFSALPILEEGTSQDGICSSSRSRAYSGAAEGDGNLGGEASLSSQATKSCMPLYEGKGRDDGCEGRKFQLKIEDRKPSEKDGSGIKYEDKTVGLGVENDKAVDLTCTNIYIVSKRNILTENLSLGIEKMQTNEQNTSIAADIGKSFESVEPSTLSPAQPAGSSLSTVLPIEGTNEGNDLRNLSTLQLASGKVKLAEVIDGKEDCETTKVTNSIFENDNVCGNVVEKKHAKMKQMGDGNMNSEILENENVGQENIENGNDENHKVMNRKVKGEYVESENVKVESMRQEHLENCSAKIENMENGDTKTKNLEYEGTKNESVEQGNVEKHNKNLELDGDKNKNMGEEKAKKDVETKHMEAENIENEKVKDNYLADETVENKTVVNGNVKDEYVGNEMMGDEDVENETESISNNSNHPIQIENSPEQDNVTLNLSFGEKNLESERRTETSSFLGKGTSNHKSLLSGKAASFKESSNNVDYLLFKDYSALRGPSKLKTEKEEKDNPHKPSKLQYVEKIIFTVSHDTCKVSSSREALASDESPFEISESDKHLKTVAAVIDADNTKKNSPRSAIKKGNCSKSSPTSASESFAVNGRHGCSNSDTHTVNARSAPEVRRFGSKENKTSPVLRLQKDTAALNGCPAGKDQLLPENYEAPHVEVSKGQNLNVIDQCMPEFYKTQIIYSDQLKEKSSLNHQSFSEGKQSDEKLSSNRSEKVNKSSMFQKSPPKAATSCETRQESSNVREENLMTPIRLSSKDHHVLNFKEKNKVKEETSNDSGQIELTKEMCNGHRELEFRMETSPVHEKLELQKKSKKLEELALLKDNYCEPGKLEQNTGTSIKPEQLEIKKETSQDQEQLKIAKETSIKPEQLEIKKETSEEQEQLKQAKETNIKSGQLDIKKETSEEQEELNVTDGTSIKSEQLVIKKETSKEQGELNVTNGTSIKSEQLEMKKETSQEQQKPKITIETSIKAGLRKETSKEKNNLEPTKEIIDIAGQLDIKAETSQEKEKLESTKEIIDEPGTLKLTNKICVELPRFLSPQYFQKKQLCKNHGDQSTRTFSVNNSPEKGHLIPELQTTLSCNKPSTAVDTCTSIKNEISSLSDNFPVGNVGTTSEKPPTFEAPEVDQSYSKDNKTGRLQSGKLDENSKDLTKCSCSAPASSICIESQCSTLFNLHDNASGLSKEGKTMSPSAMPPFLSPQFFQEKQKRCAEKLSEQCLHGQDPKQFYVTFRSNQNEAELFCSEKSAKSAQVSFCSTNLETISANEKLCQSKVICKTSDKISTLDEKPQHLIGVSPPHAGENVRNFVQQPVDLTCHKSQAKCQPACKSPDCLYVERLCEKVKDDAMLSQQEIQEDNKEVHTQRIPSQTSPCEDFNQDKSEGTSTWDASFTQPLTSTSEELLEPSLQNGNKALEMQNEQGENSFGKRKACNYQEGKNKWFFEKGKQNSSPMQREKRKYYALLLKKIRDGCGGALGPKQSGGSGTIDVHSLQQDVQEELKQYLCQKFSGKKELESNNFDMQNTHETECSVNSGVKETVTMQDGGSHLEKEPVNAVQPLGENDPLNFTGQPVLAVQVAESSSKQLLEIKADRSADQPQDIAQKVNAHSQMLDQGSNEPSCLEANMCNTGQANKPTLLSRAEIQRLIFESDSDSDLEILSSEDKEQVLRSYRSKTPYGQIEPSAVQEDSVGNHLVQKGFSKKDFPACNKRRSKSLKWLPQSKMHTKSEIPAGASSVQREAVQSSSDLPKQEQATLKAPSWKSCTPKKQEGWTQATKWKRKKKKPDVEGDKRKPEMKKNSVASLDMTESEQTDKSTHSKGPVKSVPPKTLIMAKKGNCSKESDFAKSETNTPGDSESRPRYSGSRQGQGNKKTFKSKSRDHKYSRNFRALSWDCRTPDVGEINMHLKKSELRKDSKFEAMKLTPNKSAPSNICKIENESHRLSRRDTQSPQERQSNSTAKAKDEEFESEAEDTAEAVGQFHCQANPNQECHSCNEGVMPNLTRTKLKGRGRRVVSTSGCKRSRSSEARGRWPKSDLSCNSFRITSVKALQKDN